MKYFGIWQPNFTTANPNDPPGRENALARIYLLFNKPSELAALCADLIMHTNPEHAISKSYDFFRSQFKEISSAAGIFIGVCLSGLLFGKVSAFFSGKVVKYVNMNIVISVFRARCKRRPILCVPFANLRGLLPWENRTGGTKWSVL